MPCDRTTRNLSPSVALLTLSTVDFSLLTYSGRSSTTTSCRSSSKTSASCSDRCLPPPPPPLTSSLQLRSNDSGDYNYTEFLAPFDPSSTAPSGDQQQTKQPNPSLSYDCNVRDIDLWEEALRACKALDTEQCGFISQKRFLTILSKHLSGTGGISREEVKKILRQYVRSDGDEIVFWMPRQSHQGPSTINCRLHGSSCGIALRKREKR
jgi:hypothetical protein